MNTRDTRNTGDTGRNTRRNHRRTDMTPALILASFTFFALLLVIVGFPTKAQGNDQSHAGPVHIEMSQTENRPGPQAGRRGQMTMGTCASSPRDERICLPNDPNPDRG